MKRSYFLAVLIAFTLVLELTEAKGMGKNVGRSKFECNQKSSGNEKVLLQWLVWEAVVAAVAGVIEWEPAIQELDLTANLSVVIMILF